MHYQLMRNTEICRARAPAGRSEVNTRGETHSFHLSGGFFFFLHWPELSRSDKNNGFGAVARGDGPPRSLPEDR